MNVTLLASGSKGNSVLISDNGRHLLIDAGLSAREICRRLDAVGVEPASSSSPARPDRWWAAPYDRAYVAYEWAAVVYYALRYRIAMW